MKTILPSIVGISLLLSTSALATTLWQDSFEYPAGTLTNTSGGNWIQFSSAANPVQVDGGNALLSGYSSGQDVRRPLGSSFTSGALYLGATVKLTAAPTSANGEYFLSFYNSPVSGGGYIGRIFSSQTGTGAAFGLANASSIPNDWAADANLGTYYKIIAKLDLATRVATLGVFNASYVPSSDAELTLSGGTASAITAVDSIALRQATTVQGSQMVGSIWVGTELVDVASVTIPEPGTTALLGLGLAAFALRRRK